MSKIRNSRKQPFTIVLNSFIENNKLSLKARMLGIFIFSRPPGWSVHVTHFVKIFKEGKDAIYSGFKELEENGYLRKVQPRSDLGKFKKFDYEFSQIPHYFDEDSTNDLQHDIETSPLPGFPLPDNPLPDNPQLINTNINNTDINKKEKDLSILANGPQIQKDFDIFWKKYPRKEGKAKAYARWSKIQPQGDIFFRILQSIDEQMEKRRHQAEKNDNGWSEDWPLAITWINGKRWEDEAYIDPIEAARLKGLEEWANQPSGDDSRYEARSY